MKENQITPLLIPALSELSLKNTLETVIIADVDHSMVNLKELTHYELKRFNAAWSSALRETSVLIYTIEGTLAMFKELQKLAPLMLPDILIANKGIEVYVKHGNELVFCWEWGMRLLQAGAQVNALGTAVLQHEWDRSSVKNLLAKDFKALLRPLPPGDQRALCLAYTILPGQEKGVEWIDLRTSLESIGCPSTISHGQYETVHIFPERAGVGNAAGWVLERLREQFGRPRKGTYLCLEFCEQLESLIVDQDVQVCVLPACQPLMHWWYETEGQRYHRNFFVSRSVSSAGFIEALQFFGVFKEDPHELLYEEDEMAFFDTKNEWNISILFCGVCGF
mmetsp:Transcript_13335/g.18216  ORF Transcript_13335/g.18216 Transcript_13335/m.18216 type:complete len:336 (+) Transcript_13335:104-1111(+)